MPSTDLSADDVREIAREESERATRSAWRDVGMLLGGLFVGVVAFNALSMVLFAIDPLTVVGATVVLVCLSVALVLRSLSTRL